MGTLKTRLQRCVALKNLLGIFFLIQAAFLLFRSEFDANVSEATLLPSLVSFITIGFLLFLIGGVYPKMLTMIETIEVLEGKIEQLSAEKGRLENGRYS